MKKACDDFAGFYFFEFEEELAMKYWVCSA